MKKKWLAAALCVTMLAVLTGCKSSSQAAVKQQEQRIIKRAKKKN